jgi:hypothetical protein
MGSSSTAVDTVVLLFEPASDGRVEVTTVPLRVINNLTWILERGVACGIVLHYLSLTNRRRPIQGNGNVGLGRLEIVSFKKRLV